MTQNSVWVVDRLDLLLDLEHKRASGTLQHHSSVHPLRDGFESINVLEQLERWMVDVLQCSFAAYVSGSDLIHQIVVEQESYLFVDLEHFDQRRGGFAGGQHTEEGLQDVGRFGPFVIRVQVFGGN